MQVTAFPKRPPPTRGLHHLSPWAALAAILGAALLCVLTLAVLRVGPVDSITTGSSDAPRSGVAYFEFGETTDTLWLADLHDPSKRSRLLSVPHAAEYGVVPSLSPDGRRFVYTSLAPEVRKPCLLYTSDAADE